MQATAQQRTVIINFLQQYIATQLQLIVEDEDCAEDYANTATVLIECYTAFVANNNVTMLNKSIRKELDTMVYEEVLEALEEELA